MATSSAGFDDPLQVVGAGGLNNYEDYLSFLLGNPNVDGGLRSWAESRLRDSLPELKSRREEQTEFSQGIIEDLLGNIGVGGAGGMPKGTTPGFHDLLAERRTKSGELMGMLEGFGSGQRNRIQSDFQDREGSTMAALADRGLDASNIMSGEMARLEDAEQQSMLDLEDKLIGQKVGLRSQLDEGIFGAQENEMGRRQERNLGEFEGGVNLAKGALPNLTMHIQ